MGIYLNPGKQSFEEAVNSSIYVDKTEMIRYLNTLVGTKQKYVSVSRPRRFGKTMAADMLCAYYDRQADSRDLFETRKLAASDETSEEEREPWDRYLGQFDVIRVVMTDFIKRDVPVLTSLNKIKGRILEDLEELYPGIKHDEADFAYSLEKYRKHSSYRFVVIIDEWDAVFRIRKEDQDGQTAYLDFLRDWLKDKDYIALAYMTGILPIKKYGEHSALNMFDEYSMLFPMQMAPYTGFTEEEVHELCQRFEMDFKEISNWYDGYRISDGIPVEMRQKYRCGEYHENHFSIYSPLSVVKAMLNGIIQNYWNKTETYEALAAYIRKNYDGLQDAVALLMDGGRLKIDTSSYQNDMMTFHQKDDVLALLIHLGYLGYDDETSEVFIPNREILDEFRTSTKSAEWISTFKAFELSQELLKATWNEEDEKVAELLETAHNRAGNRTYHDETALSYAVQYAYYAAQKYYTTIQELDTGKGYADIVFLPAPKYPDLPAMLVELKYNKDADTALSQIKRQRYPEGLEHYKGNMLLVGVNYEKDLRNDDPEFKHHTCTIERG